MERRTCETATGTGRGRAAPWLLLVALLCVGSPARIVARPAGEAAAYDSTTAKVSGKEDIFRQGYGSYVLECTGTFQEAGGETFDFHLRGIVSPIEVRGRLYFIGAGHAFDPEETAILRGFSLAGSTVLPPAYSIDLESRRYVLTRIDPGALDVALFVLGGDQPDFPRSGYGLGDSAELRPGTPVLSWGMPLMEDFKLSAGIVFALAAPRSLLEATYPGASADDFFVTSMPTIFGCSGALVYAFLEGRPEIVGMLVAGYININRSIVMKINALLKDCNLAR